MADSDKPNNEVLVLKQLKSIKVALWILVAVFVILPVIAGVGVGVVMGVMALSGGGNEYPTVKKAPTDWGDTEEMDAHSPSPEAWGEEEADDPESAPAPAFLMTIKIEVIPLGEDPSSIGDSGSK